MLACLSTSENNLGIVFLDNANMQDKDNHLNNIDMTTNNIDMKITNLDLNKIDVQNANIDELKPTAPSPEVQIFNTWIPIDHHHYVIENETNEETNNLTKSDFVDDRTKSELNDIITSPQSFNVI
uniref:Uncharacterized protein n=1 Tax=Acrobeloides nanus TaxID=290746 RepID=A0A914DN51_9BILA